MGPNIVLKEATYIFRRKEKTMTKGKINARFYGWKVDQH